MKKILFLILSSLFFSCSSDETLEDNNYPLFEIPLVDGNYWTYDIETETNTSRDSLYVANDTLINSILHKKMKVKNNIATGFYSNSLKNNGLRVSGNKLLLSGDLSLSAGQTLPFSLDLELFEFIVFNADVNSGETLSTKSGTIQETVNGYPLTINYTLKSVSGNTFENYTAPNNDTYSNVKSNKIILTARIETSVSGFSVFLINEQDVMVSEQFIAKNIGVVHTNTVTTYTLNPSIPAQLLNQIPFPSSQTQTQSEFLDTYQVN